MPIITSIKPCQVTEGRTSCFIADVVTQTIALYALHGDCVDR